MSIDHSQMRLGRKPGAPGPRVPRLSNHMAMQVPKPAVDWTGAVKEWPMLANDSVGDCTAAGCLHLLQVWLNTHGIAYTPTVAEALALYGDTSDYPKEDAGAVEQVVLSYWAKNSISLSAPSGSVAFAALNPRDLNDVKLSIEYFGGCYFGLALPITAQSQEVWDVTPVGLKGYGALGSWGGHCVVAVAYDGQYVTVVTWGKLLKVTPAFLSAYLEEAYAVVSRDWLDKQGVSPPGLDFAALQAEMRAIAG